MPQNYKFNFKYLFKIIIYLLAILIALYLVLLASGYKLDWTHKKFFQTGSIYLNSNPKDVKVYLNGKLKAVKTPFKLGYQLPGEYEIRIEKEGYQNWQKNLTVKAGLVANEDQVILFYNHSQESEFGEVEGVLGMKINQAKNEIIYWTKKEIYRQKTDASEAKKIITLNNAKIEAVDAGFSFERILIKTIDLGTQKESFLYCQNQECSQSFDLGSGLALNFDRGVITNDGSYPLLASAESNLYLINQDLAKSYIDSNVLHYLFFGGRVYYMKASESEVQLISSDPQGQDKKIITTQSAVASEANNFALSVDPYKNRLFFIGKNKILYQVDEKKQLLAEIVAGADSLNFDNKNFLLIKNGSELKVRGRVELHDNDDTLRLAARYSADPLDPQWLLKTNHLLFISDNILRTVELRGSNETDLYTFNNPQIMSFVSISKNEAIVLDNFKLNKLTLCELESLIDLWQ